MAVAVRSEPVWRAAVPFASILGYAGAMSIGNEAESRYTARRPNTTKAGQLGRYPFSPSYGRYLEAVFDEAEPGTEYIITRYRDGNANLRTQLERIIRKAGLKPWPKLFQNLRSARRNRVGGKLSDARCLCEWIGNSAAVAAKHYLQVTDEHYRQASKEAVQNPVQQARGNGLQSTAAETRNPGISGVCGPLRYCTNGQVGGKGLEPSTSTV